MVAPMSPTPSNVPIYHVPAMYPSGPILSFPPPAPSAGQTLRERAGVTLSLRIKTSFGTPDSRSPGKVNTQPHRNNLPRRRKATKRPSYQHPDLNEKDVQVQVAEKPLVEEQPHVDVKEKEEAWAYMVQTAEEVSFNYRSSNGYDTLPGFKPETTNYLQELIPGLHLAFSDADPSAEQPRHPTGLPWTHVVNITYPSADSECPKGRSEQTTHIGLQRLHLVLPSATRAHLSNTTRPGLGLTDAHLRTTRDFIAQALPRHIASLPDQSSVRVLITTPYGRPTDAMCAAGCALSFTSGREVDTVLRFVDEEEEFLSIWKGEVSEDEMERTQKIASAWSWLSQIAKLSLSP